jgi:hypothetical protein
MRKGYFFRHQSLAIFLGPRGVSKPSFINIALKIKMCPLRKTKLAALFLAILYSDNVLEKWN